MPLNKFTQIYVTVSNLQLFAPLSLWSYLTEAYEYAQQLFVNVSTKHNLILITSVMQI
jgi:hypothetical protein